MKKYTAVMFMALSLSLNVLGHASDVTDDWVQEFAENCASDCESDILSQAETKSADKDEVHAYCHEVCSCTGLKIQKNLTMTQLDTFEDSDDDPVGKKIDAFTDQCIDENLGALSE